MFVQTISSLYLGKGEMAPAKRDAMGLFSLIHMDTLRKHFAPFRDANSRFAMDFSKALFRPQWHEEQNYGSSMG
jgi:hypothetical protein